MAKLTQTQIDHIRQSVNIVDVIGSYIPLTKKGKSYWAVCPFHDDHDPSMSISSDKQIYKCFVCNNGGNVFNFVSQFESISFVQAVKKVADFANIPLEIKEDVIEYNSFQKEGHKINREVINYCTYTLKSYDGLKAQEYLSQRGLNEQIIEHFEIGYYPNENNKVLNFLRAKGYDDATLVKYKLAHLNDYGINDIFRNRILFPIYDEYGNPIGFTARSIDKNNEPKYLNTSESELFIKGNTLYHYHKALPSIKKNKFVYLVEGPMDVIALYRIGIENVVCSNGTALTNNQVKLISRVCKDVIIYYDSDQAGLNAIYKASKLFKQYNLNFKIIIDKNGKDPDEILNTLGEEALLRVVDNKINYLDFLFYYFKAQYNLDNYEDKKLFARKMVLEAEDLDDFDKEELLNRLAELTNFSIEILNSQIKVKQKKINDNWQKKIKNVGLSKYQKAERNVIYQLLLSKKAVKLYLDNLDLLYFDEERKLMYYILDYYSNNDEMIVSNLLDHIKEDDIKNLLVTIIMNELNDPNYNEAVLLENIATIKNYSKEIRIKELEESLQLVNDPVERSKLYIEIINLKRDRRNYG